MALHTLSCPLTLTLPVMMMIRVASSRPQPLGAAPHTVAHARRDLAAPEALVDEPRAHDELALAQRRPHPRAALLPEPVHQVPHLGELGAGQPAAGPDVAHHHAGHVLRELLVAPVAHRGGAAAAGPEVVLRIRARRHEEQPAVARPYGLVALPLALRDLLAPPAARPLVVGVLLAVDEALLVVRPPGVFVV